MCGCGRRKGSNEPQVWSVYLPGVAVPKTYSSEIAARAKVKAVPGATLKPPAGVSV